MKARLSQDDAAHIGRLLHHLMQTIDDEDAAKVDLAKTLNVSVSTLAKLLGRQVVSQDTRDRISRHLKNLLPM